MPSIVGVDRADERSARSTCDTNTLAVVAAAAAIFVPNCVSDSVVSVSDNRLRISDAQVFV